MADYPYIPNYGNLKKFLAHIQTAGKPPKVTTKYLESVGFKSKNDRPIIAVLKYIAFIDSSGAPTESWQEYRNKGQAPVVLAQAIKSAYKDLFDTYPDAERRDNEALRNYFSSSTTVGEGAITQIVRTFQALCGLADFSEDGAVAKAIKPPAEKTPAPIMRTEVKTAESGRGLVLNLNIQLQIPATDDAAIYDKFFAAMKKHLMS